MVLISKDRSGKTRRCYKIAAMIGKSWFVSRNRIGQPVKTKAPGKAFFMTVRQLLHLKSRLKMKPINPKF
jgi:hypothetical protein